MGQSMTSDHHTWKPRDIASPTATAPISRSRAHPRAPACPLQGSGDRLTELVRLLARQAAHEAIADRPPKEENSHVETDQDPTAPADDRRSR